MDAEIESAYALASRKFDIELKLLIDAIYHLYHYDFRDYAQASLRRRLKAINPPEESPSLAHPPQRFAGVSPKWHADGQLTASMPSS